MTRLKNDQIVVMTTPREAGLVPAETNGKVEEDVMKQKQEELQEQSLIPVKEDLADWITKILGVNVTVDNFMEVLDNGVYLCKLANVIQKKAEECVAQGTYTEPLPDIRLKCKSNATSGSWFARDNTANFLSWCKAYGMQGESMFETEDLVSHKMEKSVINCILELARIGYKFGLDPVPNLIKIEKEIEKEEEAPVQISRPTSSKPSNLDDEVRRIAFKCKCHDHIKKIGEGKYLIFGKVVQIRFLKNRHLMVRVGGGWDTLENYLLHHRPIEVFEHRRGGGQRENALDKKYLYIKSQYVS